MDGLDDYLDSPISWAKDVILEVESYYDHDLTNEETLRKVIEDNYDFIQATFEEQQLPVPSETEIFKEVKKDILERDQNDS